MHVLTRIARPAEKEVPLSYFDFMAKDSVRTFISFTVILISHFYVFKTLHRFRFIFLVFVPFHILFYFAIFLPVCFFCLVLILVIFLILTALT